MFFLFRLHLQVLQPLIQMILLEDYKHPLLFQIDLVSLQQIFPEPVSWNPAGIRTLLNLTAFPISERLTPRLSNFDF